MAAIVRGRVLAPDEPSACTSNGASGARPAAAAFNRFDNAVVIGTE